jgi:hypothetical protein
LKERKERQPPRCGAGAVQVRCRCGVFNGTRRGKTGSGQSARRHRACAACRCSGGLEAGLRFAFCRARVVGWGAGVPGHGFSFFFCRLSSLRLHGKINQGPVYAVRWAQRVGVRRLPMISDQSRRVVCVQLWSRDLSSTRPVFYVFGRHIGHGEVHVKYCVSLFLATDLLLGVER